MKSPLIQWACSRCNLLQDFSLSVLQQESPSSFALLTRKVTSHFLVRVMGCHNCTFLFIFELGREGKLPHCSQCLSPFLWKKKTSLSLKRKRKGGPLNYATSSIMSRLGRAKKLHCSLLESGIAKGWE